MYDLPPQNVTKTVLVNVMMESIGSRKGAKPAKNQRNFAPLRALRESSIILTNTKCNKNLRKTIDKASVFDYNQNVCSVVIL